MQADTIVPEPGNPQALNRYAYVTNNPLRYTDPTGHYILLEHAEEGFSEFSVIWRESNWYILSGGRWYRNYYERAFANYFLGHPDTLPPPAPGAFASRAMVGAATNAYRANEGILSIGSGLDILSDPALIVAAAIGMMKAVGVAKDEIYGAAQRISGDVARAAALTEMHHTIPREVLKGYLPPDVANAVRGRRGDPNRWAIPKDLHADIHRGPGGGLYNQRFIEELQRLGRLPSVADVRGIRDALAVEFGFEEYRPR